MNSTRLAITFCIFGLLGVVSAVAVAEDSKWYEGIAVNGFVSAAYSYNFNKPESGLNQFRVFDFDDNSFKLDVAELVIQKAVAQPDDVGFRVDAVAGASIPRVIASSGLFRNADGTGEDFDLEQAYVTYFAPVGDGLRLDFGKFITHTGAEVIEGYDGFNDNYSRSILFGFAIPFTHTGLRGTYVFNDKITGMFMLANGWDNVKDNNRGKTFGAQLIAVPVTNLTLYINYCGGPEQAGSSDMRNLLDFVAVWKFRSNMTFTLNTDWASDKNGAGANVDASWNGIAGYLRIDSSDSCYLTLRVERFNDDDGVRTGVVQHLTEFTITPTYKLTGQFLLRGDLRFDRSNKDVFDDHGDASKSQTSIAFNAIYLF